MRCPFCGATDTRVIDSRLAGEGSQVRRRRECVRCKERYTTYESAELDLPRIVKRDGRRETFSLEKLRTGIDHALEKRAISADTVEEIIDHVRHLCLTYSDREIPANQLGEWVMNELREVDQVAYVRFASVYRSFKDVSEFREIIDYVENDPSPEMRKSQLSLIKDK
ncbi:MAG: transcriptional regulator NrdR [Gammaproteobacteria bacterium TMED119]|nr:MAG: transcriptional regulator NrdR [Gammaproteobacteria bacterium TMED119]